MKYLIYIVLIFVILFFVRKWLSKFKFPKCGAVTLFTGGVKKGKSAVSLACAVSNYKRVHRRWRFACILRNFTNMFRKQSNKLDLPEEPFFYSTIDLRCIKYVRLTREHLLRQKRLHYGSVTFIDEASLIADSMLYKDKVVNDQLLLFVKLYGHATRGGLLIINTHCIGDLHFALRRCVTEYFEIHHISKYIPFFTLAYMREERYSEDGQVVNSYDEDIEDSQKRVLMRKRVFKFYDCYCFSSFTDDLSTDTSYDIQVKDRFASLKMKEIVSFNPVFYNLGKEEKNEKKNS